MNKYRKVRIHTEYTGVLMSLGLHRPSFPEREPGRGHFISQPHAAVGLHKWAVTGGGTFRQLGSQLMGAVGALLLPNQTQSAAIRLPSIGAGELVTLTASSLGGFTN